MSLVTYGGKPLLVGGKLTTDPDCCCADPPIECPRCCIRIEWGTFNDDGDLTASYTSSVYTIEVTIVMPTKNSRVVCDEESITIEMEVVGSPDPGDNHAWVQFGSAWKSTANTPSVDATDGKVFDKGLVEWGSIENRNYSVTLAFDKCWLDTADMLAYIFVGMDNPSFSDEIEITRCLPTDFCCDDELVCDNCCYQYASTETGWVNDGLNFCKVLSNDLYTVRICVQSGTPGFACAPDDVIDIFVSVIPHRYDPDEEVRVMIDWQLWDCVTFSPAVAADGVGLCEQSGMIDWGHLDEYEYLLKLEGGCECGSPDFGGIEVNFFGPADLPDLRLVEDISFTPCPDQNDCCPQPCDYVTGLFGSRAAAAGMVTDPPAEPGDDPSTCQTDLNWRAGGSQARWIPPPGPGVGCSTNWIGAHCSGINEPGGEDGFEATFSTAFEIAEGACLENIVLKGRFSADNYVKAGGWKVNGVDQGHIEHGSYNSTVTMGCIEFEIDYAQGGWVIGTNTIEITVKNGYFLSAPDYGGPFGLVIEIGCISRDPEEY